MKKILLSFIVVPSCLLLQSQGRIGINTTTPQAMLHVKDSSVLFSLASLPGVPGDPPANGAGLRMMWYPAKGAFRAGESGGNNWNKDSIGNYSFAVGNGSRAKGISAFAAGTNSLATGEYSTVLGFSAIASEDYATALGRQVTASGTAAVATGYGGHATGLASTVTGYFCTAEGAYSTAMGFSTNSVGQMSLAVGYDTEAEGIVSIASGYRSHSIGSYSFSGGFQTESVPFASFAIGRYNENTIGTSATWVDTDPIFMIGNGEDNTTRSNSFTVLKNGKTMINGSAPLAALSIKGYDGSENNHLQLEDNNSVESGRIYYTGDLHFKNSRVGGDFFFRDDANSIIFTLFSTGNTTIAGTLTQNSDARLKKDLQSLESPLEKVLKLNGYHYRWIDDKRDAGIQTGFTAQEIEAILPELVTTSDDGTKSVNYIGIIPYLTEAIKELAQKNADLEKKMLELKHTVLPDKN
jgi:hypothetical protein